jgi:hypothetical protein
MNYDGPWAPDHNCMNGLFTVQAQRLTRVDSSMGIWHGSKQLPTFYVDASSETEAIKKATDILCVNGDTNYVIDVCEAKY